MVHVPGGVIYVRSVARDLQRIDIVTDTFRQQRRNLLSLQSYLENLVVRPSSSSTLLMPLCIRMYTHHACMHV
jgi:hypothetical protein